VASAVLLLIFPLMPLSLSDATRLGRRQLGKLVTIEPALPHVKHVLRFLFPLGALFLRYLPGGLFSAQEESNRDHQAYHLSNTTKYFQSNPEIQSS
jgi:hypothetical protein